MVPFRTTGRLAFVQALLLSIIGFVGCARNPVAGLDHPEKLTLYSIQEAEHGKEPKTAETFHGYEVLGKFEVDDPKKRKELIAALKGGLARSDGSMNKCFWPHHAIRAVENGQTVDYVICFYCLQLARFMNGASEIKAVTADPQPVFDKLLEEAGVPLSDDLKKGDTAKPQK
jgi:hypothetical protein